MLASSSCKSRRGCAIYSVARRVYVSAETCSLIDLQGHLPFFPFRFCCGGYVPLPLVKFFSMIILVLTSISNRFGLEASRLGVVFCLSHRLACLASIQRLYPVSSWASWKQHIFRVLYSCSLNGRHPPFRSAFTHDVGWQRYKRDEFGLRLAYFHCGANVAQFFGALLASGIFATTDGKFGVAAWR